MILITFDSATTLNFSATLHVGAWAGLAVAADDNAPGQPVVHLDEFTRTSLRVGASNRLALAFSADEDAGDPYLHLGVYNLGGSALSVLVPGGDTVVIQPNNGVEIIYNRHRSMKVTPMPPAPKP